MVLVVLLWVIRDGVVVAFLWVLLLVVEVVISDGGVVSLCYGWCNWQW